MNMKDISDVEEAGFHLEDFTTISKASNAQKNAQLGLKSVCFDMNDVQFDVETVYTTRTRFDLSLTEQENGKLKLSIISL